MSELLQLAGALRASDDAEIRRAFLVRKSNLVAAKDYFDLADSFLNAKSAAKALATLPRSLALTLQALIAGEPIQANHISELQARYLIYVEHEKPVVFDSVKSVMATLPKISLGQVTSNPESQEIRKSELAQTAFTALQSVSELLYDFEYRFVREIGKNGISLVDVKRLAAHLRQSNDFIREIFWIAQMADLVMLRNGRWQPSASAESWLELSYDLRWNHLTTALIESLEKSSVAELLTLRGAGISNLKEIFGHAFPFADSATSDAIDKFQAAASHLALAQNGIVTDWFQEVLAGGLQKVTKEVETLLPKPQDRLICQADLTLIAPGPLTTATEKKLRSFVDTEQVGMASSYRINALSVSHGLESGLTELEITELLTGLSGRDLPQPLGYLIRDVAQKFGQLTVTQSLTEHHCTIQASDSILLKQIENDSRLKPIGLKRNADSLLQSRMDAEIVYNALRSAGYTAVRTDTEGKVISPRTALTPSPVGTAIDSLTQMLKTIRENDAQSEPEGDDLLRQIQLALKNKSQLEVVVKTNSGDEVTFTLEPVGLANNRLRAKDRKADIERTLPLDKILRVKLSE